MLFIAFHVLKLGDQNFDGVRVAAKRRKLESETFKALRR
jgi:hypothetical protein